MLSVGDYGRVCGYSQLVIRAGLSVKYGRASRCSQWYRGE